ncbi:MAG: hypothetical protein U1B80_00840, partial [Anaerolineaceae bacterium]|nr:hypothetical protein [Anaerolineaceae bacterium]
MPACELCGEDVNNKGIPLRLYRGYLLQREVSKGELHSTRAVSTYQRFEPVNVLVCSRHLKNLWVQRLIAGLFAYLLLFFPVVMVVSWLVKWHPQATTLQFILGALLSMLLA